jgi:hypothetical protein
LPVSSVEVAAVLDVEVDDLELGHQDLGGGQRVLALGQALRQRQPVTHLEALDEAVDLAPVVLVVEEQPAVPVEGVELLVGRIARVGHQRLEGAAVAPGQQEVEVADDAVVGGMQPRAGQQADRHAADQARLQVLPGDQVQQAPRLRIDVRLDRRRVRGHHRPLHPQPTTNW